MDLHARGQLSFDRIRYMVLDEVDRMLDIGFLEDIRKILKNIPAAIDKPVSEGGRQTIFVSATMDVQIERLARSFMKPDSEKITTVSGSLTVAMVDQKYLPVEAVGQAGPLAQAAGQRKTRDHGRVLQDQSDLPESR